MSKKSIALPQSSWPMATQFLALWPVVGTARTWTLHLAFGVPVQMRHCVIRVDSDRSEPELQVRAAPLNAVWHQVTGVGQVPDFNEVFPTR
jgi:hypothetical protein